MPLPVSPLTLKRLQRFRRIKRGYYSFIGLLILISLALVAELWVNNRALLVYYEGELYWPTFGDFIPGTEFGEDYEWETDYRDLKARLAGHEQSGFVLMPLIPYSPYENDLQDNAYPPFAPDIDRQHYLGTDQTGRDMVARLVYGFRTAILFSLGLMASSYTVGVMIGCLMGYWGGRFDLTLQRLIEIWSNIPFLYVVIILASIMTPGFWLLIGIMVCFSWPVMTWYMRTATYREKAREYALAAKAMGATTPRIIFHHILPNTVSTIVTFIPFSVATGITSLTALDYLGFGLPPPTPSWGELLQQGTNNLDAIWIVSSVVVFMVAILTMVTFTGEAIREAFDPKKHSIYR
jgi:microcin C transport system permease protein